MPRRTGHSLRRGVILACVLLSGCSSKHDWMYDQYFQIARQSFQQSLGRQRVSREEAAAIPYASMGYRVDGGGQSLLVLASDTNGELLWTARSKVVLLTRNGRITRTVGLKRDIAAVTPQAGRLLPEPARALAGPVASERLADFPDIAAYGVPLSCTLSRAGVETITILGRAMRTIRVDERCRSPRIRWSFTDSYWIAPDSGLALRTLQHIHPGGDTIETEIFRAPG